MGCDCCREGARPPYVRIAVSRHAVSVELAGVVANVYLPTLPSFERDERRLVRLVDLWAAAAGHGGAGSTLAALDDLRFDFVGDDGFDSAIKNRPPIDARLLEEGSLDLATRDLLWSADVCCCYQVKGLARMIARPLVRAPTPQAPR